MLLSAASGCAAAVYLLVWDQLLQRAAASWPVAAAIFFGGLCLGSFMVRRWSETLPRLFGFLQLGLAILGLPLLWLLPFAGPLGLLVPGALMGACMALGARRTDGDFLFTGGAVGAACGCLVAGFWVLPHYDQTTATLFAAALHLLIGAATLRLNVPEPGAPSETDGRPRSIYAAVALTAAGAAGAAIVWTRLLIALMGATVYAYIILLAAALTGLALGGIAGAWAARAASPRAAFGVCQMLLLPAMFWTSFMLAASLPYWPINPVLVDSPWFAFQLDMARALWTLLPPALVWGASVSLALAAAGRNQSSNVCAAGSCGLALGTLGVSLGLVASIGVDQTQRLLLIGSTMSAVAALSPYVRLNKAVGSLLVSSVMVALLCASWVPPVPGELIAYGRQMPAMLGQSEILFTKDGVYSSVAVSRWPSGAVYLSVNGHIEATTEIYDLALPRMLAHLPGILHPGPRSVLSLGFGAGMAAGAFTQYPGIERITIVEKEPVVVEASTKSFAEENYQVASKAAIVSAAVRRFIVTTEQKFDIIAAEPNDVFAKANAALYTKEFFDAVRRRLNPGGFFAIYLPLYESDVPTVQSQLATFFAAFPNATVWANTREGQGYDMVLLGPAGPLNIDLDAVQARLRRSEYAPVAESLREVGFLSALDLLATYTGGANDLGRWFKAAEVTRDGNLRLMYLAGRAIHAAQAGAMYREILSYREAPRNLFQGSAGAVEELLVRIGGGN